MGFFSSIGNFISQNVQSAVHDVTHVVQQIAPIAIGAIPSLIPGGSLVTGLLGGLGGSSGGGAQQTAPVDTSATDAINQLNAYLQAHAAQNANLAAQVAAANTNNTATSKTFMENVKAYWYFIAIPVVAIAGWFMFKPKKRGYAFKR